MVTAEEVLQQLKDTLHTYADAHDWSKHHSFGPENHVGSNHPSEMYWTGFNDGYKSLAHRLLVQICTANAAMR